MSEKLHPDRHILLYAKGHYRREPEKMFQELRVLVGNHTGVIPTKVDILRVVWSLAAPHLMIGEINPKERLLTIFERLIEITQQENRPLAVEDIVRHLIAILGHTKVKDGDTVLINLGEPDYSLFSPS
jgi:hypothetical protein